MKIDGTEIDTSKLISKNELLEYLNLNGACDRVLADIRERYDAEFENELMWQYPISDGLHAGVTIVVVKEGFLSLPYDDMDKIDYEIYELDHASLFDEDSLRYFIDDWKMFSDDLLNALGDMLNIIKNK